MKTAIVLVVLLIGGMLAPAAAGDMKAAPSMWRYTAPSHDLPFPRGERAQSVWAAGACWSECGSYCAWGLAGCLQADRQGRCLKLTDKCDRYCQRECRTQGGPLLPFMDF